MIFVSLRVILFDFSGLNLELDSINTNDPYAIGLWSFDVPVLLRDEKQLSFVQTELPKGFRIILKIHLSRSA